jgi:two-component system response regulator AtoC
MSLKVLLVDDDHEALQSTGKILSFSGHEVVQAESGVQALGMIESVKPDLIVTDVRMPGMSGMEFMEACSKRGHRIPFIVMTAHAGWQDAVWAMKLGAVDFLEKPFKRQALLDGVEQIGKRVRPPHVSGSAANSLVGSSRVMAELRMLIEQIARTEASVLLTGESGTGKEQVARLIHERSPCAKGPFVALNCAAIPAELIESELFGFEAGAFTGAGRAKTGLIESANGGTLLLDEIGDMPLSLQPKLLRVLEEQQVRRLGSNSERKVEVRVIAATHQNLGKLVQEGRFRQDLYYRLDVMTLALPALRDRMEDIPELTQYFLQRFSKVHAKPIRGIDTEAQALLLGHHWPGNVRELSNALERAVVLNQGGLIACNDLPPHLVSRASPGQDSSGKIVIPLGMSLKEMEDLMFRRALEASGGDRAEAARLLGVAERTIYRWITKTKEG